MIQPTEKSGIYSFKTFNSPKPSLTDIQSYHVDKKEVYFNFHEENSGNNWFSDRLNLGIGEKIQVCIEKKPSIGLGNINTAIEDSKYMLELEEDWDDEGGMPIDEVTFERASDFLLGYAEWLLDNKNVVIQTPEISPGPENSIDIHWRLENYRMLINIPSNPQKQAGFYGDDTNKWK